MTPSDWLLVVVGGLVLLYLLAFLLPRGWRIRAPAIIRRARPFAVVAGMSLTDRKVQISQR
jgi:hypothetical protein